MKVLLSWIALCGVLCGVAQASRPFPVGEPLRGVPQTNRNGRAPEGVEENLSLGQETRQLIQQGLRAEGFDPGAADGVFRPAHAGGPSQLAGGTRETNDRLPGPRNGRHATNGWRPASRRKGVTADAARVITRARIHDRRACLTRCSNQ